MKHFSIFAMALLLMACNGKSGSVNGGNDSTKVEQAVIPAAEDNTVSPSDPIPGMEMSDLEEVGVKAWISDGIAYWNIYDQKKYLKVTDLAPEFYRCGDGPFAISGMDETPVGVYLAKLDKFGNTALYIIGHKRHVFALDIPLEVSLVGGGAGMIGGLENIESFRQEGKTVYAVDEDGESREVRFYSDEGPYQFSVNDNENDYYFELSSTWNIRLSINNIDHYEGRFGSEGNGSFTFTLTRHFRYDEDVNEFNVNDCPIKGTFRVNNNNNTITFLKDVLDLPQNVALAYEVFALFD